MIAWFRKWWWVFALLILAIVVAIITVGKVLPNMEEIVKTAEAQADAKKLEARIGRDAAIKTIENQYAKTIDELDENQKKEAAELQNDPGARARFYARVAVKRARENA